MTITGTNDALTTGVQLVSDSDHVQLMRLATEFVWRVDHGLASTLGDLVADDVEMTIGGGTLRGRQAVTEWGQRLETPTWNAIRHAMVNPRYVYDGPDAAIGSRMLIVFMDADGTRSSVPWNVGEDHDRYVRTDAGWRFASIRWVEEFSRGDTLTIP